MFVRTMFIKNEDCRSLDLRSYSRAKKTKRAPGRKTARARALANILFGPTKKHPESYDSGCLLKQTFSRKLEAAIS